MSLCDLLFHDELAVAGRRCFCKQTLSSCHSSVSVAIDDVVRPLELLLKLFLLLRNLRLELAIPRKNFAHCTLSSHASIDAEANYVVRDILCHGDIVCDEDNRTAMKEVAAKTFVDNPLGGVHVQCGEDIVEEYDLRGRVHRTS
jgi:hypothetical protein